MPTKKAAAPTNERHDILELVDDLVGETLAEELPPNMVGGPWVEIYSPDGRNHYKRRRCRVNVGGQLVGSKWVGGRIRKQYIRYLGNAKDEQRTKAKAVMV